MIAPMNDIAIENFAINNSQSIQVRTLAGGYQPFKSKKEMT